LCGGHGGTEKLIVRGKLMSLAFGESHSANWTCVLKIAGRIGATCIADPLRHHKQSDTGKDIPYTLGFMTSFCQGDDIPGSFVMSEPIRAL
jgi:hypothetical protein